MTNRQIIDAFVDCINDHDVTGLGELMSDDHKFVDAHGNQVSGKAQMMAGWRGYFEWFPDYFIEVVEVFEPVTGVQESSFAMFGFAGGSFKGDAKAAWRLPAAWKAIVKDERIALWQVFADTKIPFELIERNS